jgi:hypothetical protein
MSAAPTKNHVQPIRSWTNPHGAPATYLVAAMRLVSSANWNAE